MTPTGKPKPPAAGRGRVKGSQNKLTKTIKAAIEAAFDKVGGPDYLAKMAMDEPVAFMTLLGKVLPTQLASDPENPLTMVAKIELVGVQPE